MEGQKLLGPLAKLAATDVVDASTARGKPVTIIGTTRSRAMAAARVDAAVPATPAEPEAESAAPASTTGSEPAQAAAADAPTAPQASTGADWAREAAAAVAAPVPAAALHRLAAARSPWTVVVDVEGVLVR